MFSDKKVHGCKLNRLNCWFSYIF